VINPALMNKSSGLRKNSFSIAISDDGFCVVLFMDVVGYRQGSFSALAPRSLVVSQPSPWNGATISASVYWPPDCSWAIALMGRRVFQQDTPDFLDNLGLALAGMVRADHPFGHRLVDVGAPVGHYAVISRFLRAIAFHRDDGVGRNPG
jgi:hypothetical protein